MNEKMPSPVDGLSVIDGQLRDLRKLLLKKRQVQPPARPNDNANTMQTVYISTFLGNRFYPTECRIDQIDIEDIAHGLAYEPLPQQLNPLLPSDAKLKFLEAWEILKC